MQTFSCLIIEDEPLAAGILEEYIGQVPYLDLSGTCTDAIQAIDVLNKSRIDLVFLDIHLPRLKGLDFIRTIKTPPQIIITTAYPDYALQGFELQVLDYLLKPIEFPRFLAAVNRMRNQMETDSSATPHMPVQRPHLYFHVSKKKVKVWLDDILYIESLREYIRITARNQSILTKLQLGHVEQLLPHQGFMRIHRSFIVAKDKIEAYTATDIEINGKQIPIGRNYKEQVLAALEGLES